VSDPTRRDVLRWGMIGGLGLAGGVNLLAACSAGSRTKVGASDTIKIGVVSPFSGIGYYVGVITRNSLEAAVRQVNATGGVGGRKVELVLRDAGQELTNGVRAYQVFLGVTLSVCV